MQENFELPNTDDKEGYKFAPGAMDGICMYHMGDKTLVDEDKKKLKELIILAGNGYTSKAEIIILNNRVDYIENFRITDIQSF